MSSPFIRRSTAITAGAVVFAGLVAAPVAAFADSAVLDPIPSGLDGAVTATADSDGVGTLYTLTKNVTTYTTIAMPDEATLDGNGHTITAVEDADHNFGAVVASAHGTDSAPAELGVKNLNIATDHFAGEAKNSGGKLAGIYLFRAGGTLSNISVDGISHGNGVSEGDAIVVRNRVSDTRAAAASDADYVPRAHVELQDVQVTKYQKTGMLFDGNVSFSVKGSSVGRSASQGNPAIAPNSMTIIRGASGLVSDSTLTLNDHADSTAALLLNAKTVEFNSVTINGDAPATTGIDVSNDSNTIDTNFTMRGGEVTRTAAPAGGTGLLVEGAADAITATTIDTKFTGWTSDASSSVVRTTTPTTTTPTTPPTTPPAPVVTKVDVSGQYKASRPHARQLRVDFRAFKLGANQTEGKQLRWRIKVDGHPAATTRQHAGDTDVWTQHFAKSTRTHTVEIIKNGVSQHTYKVHTR